MRIDRSASHNLRCENSDKATIDIEINPIIAEGKETQ